jgi:hypothetical protein
MHSNPPVDRWWLGPVESRAKKWAEAVFRRTGGKTPWPVEGGLISAHARKAIADLLPTSPTGEEMIRHCYEVARRRTRRCGSDGESRCVVAVEDDGLIVRRR